MAPPMGVRMTQSYHGNRAGETLGRAASLPGWGSGVPSLEMGERSSTQFRSMSHPQCPSSPTESGQGACLLGTLYPSPTGHWAQVPGETSPCSDSAGDSQPILGSENLPTPPPLRERKLRSKDRTGRPSDQ